MNKLDDVMQKMEKVGFPEKDSVSALKFLFFTGQMESLGISPEKAQKILLSAFHNDGKANSKNFIEIFRQSDINGSYFDLKGKIQFLKIQGNSFGFDSEKFIKDAQLNPSLLFINPSRVVEKVNAIDDAYAQKGFTGADFFKIGCEFPSLLANDSNKIEDKIETLHDFFSSYGVKWETLFAGIKKQSRLLSVDADTVIRHAKILLRDHRRGFWSVNGTGCKESDAEALTAVLLSRPMGLNLSDKNLKMRRIYALIEDEKKTGVLKLGTYLRSKKSLFPIFKDALITKGRQSLWERLQGNGYFDVKQND